MTATRPASLSVLIAFAPYVGVRSRTPLVCVSRSAEFACVSKVKLHSAQAASSIGGLSKGHRHAPSQSVRESYPDGMPQPNDMAEFLASRRARITPEQAGLPSYGTRRVPGLRREEVASLAGVGIDYYRSLERGNVRGVSDERPRGAGTGIATRRRRTRAPAGPHTRTETERSPSGGVQSDSASGPAFYECSRASTDQRRYATPDWTISPQTSSDDSLYRPLFESSEQPPNSARFTFLDPAAVDTPTGSVLPMIPWPCCGPRQAGTQTSGPSQIL